MKICFWRPNRIEVLTDAINQLRKDVAKMANELNGAIAQLQADVTAEKTVEDSAITLINGIPAMIAAAIASALAQGATPEQLQALKDLSTTIEANASGLATAVTANTPPPAA